MSERQALTDDVLWHVSSYLTSTRDILNLGLTKHAIWSLVQPDLYATEVIQTRNSRGPMQMRYPAIHEAIQSNLKTTIERLISAAIRHWPEYLNTPNACGLRPVHLAASRGNVPLLERFRQQGCSFDAEVALDPFGADLFTNHSRINLPAFDTLCAWKLGNHPYRTEHIDALGLSIVHGHRNATEYLSNHIDESRLTSSNRTSVSPLQIAALLGDVGGVRKWLERGCPPVTTRYRQGLNRQTIVGTESALHYAATRRSDNSQVLACLLAHGADLNTRAMSIYTALDVALRNTRGGFKNAEFLVDYSIKHNQIPAGHWGDTLADAAIDDRMLPAVRSLITQTQAVTQDQLMQVLLNLTRCMKGNPQKIFDLIMDVVFGPSPTPHGSLIPWNQCREKGPYRLWFPETVLQGLQMALWSDETHFERVLQWREWNINARDIKGRTAFVYAVHFRRYAAAFALLERGADWTDPGLEDLSGLARWLRARTNKGGDRSRYGHWAGILERAVGQVSEERRLSKLAEAKAW
ncbi:hypothetical protein PG993_009725 [Apiospora rasikravindrae]|uniref:Ankyrin n=1 Tax=Apiospora rasikravindrae TaxID=990691 RepID=A0ABR1SLZ4_9PEZI